MAMLNARFLFIGDKTNGWSQQCCEGIRQCLVSVWKYRPHHLLEQSIPEDRSNIEESSELKANKLIMERCKHPWSQDNPGVTDPSATSRTAKASSLSVIYKWTINAPVSSRPLKIDSDTPWDGLWRNTSRASWPYFMTSSFLSLHSLKQVTRCCNEYWLDANSQQAMMNLPKSPWEKEKAPSFFSSSSLLEIVYLIIPWP